MKDAIEMWKNPRLIVLTALCAAVYAAAMIPLKGLVIFPGLAELRPATVLPTVFSLLFGPAGAWGAAFGNVAGDVLGAMLGPGSVFGFLANFAYGYLPYKLWEAIGPEREVDEELNRWREKVPARLFRPLPAILLAAGLLALSLIVIGLGHSLHFWDLAHLKWKLGAAEFTPHPFLAIFLLSGISAVVGTGLIYLVFSPLPLVGIIFISSLACAVLLGWAIELLGFFPFRVFAPWILLNNFVISIVLGPSLILLFYPRVKKMRLLYRDLLGENRPRPSTAGAGAVLTVISTVGLFGAGLFLPADTAAQVLGLSGNLAKGILLSPFVVFFWAGLLMLSH